MKRAALLQGSYVFGDREVSYWTKCPYCPELEQRKKRRAAVPGCDTVAQVRFLIDSKGKVGWSGVITLKNINRIVKDYLECDEDELPDDVAVPMRQLRMEL